MAKERPIRQRIRSYLRQERPLQAILPQKTKEFFYGTPHFALISGNAGMHIAKEVAERLGKSIPDNPASFANNELRVLVPQDIATKDVYVIQSTDDAPDSALTQLRLLEEGAKGVGVNRITAIVTHLPYSRQDRRERPGAPEAARLLAREIVRAGSHDPQKRRHESALRAKANLILVDVHSTKPLEPLTKSNDIQWANLDPRFVVGPKVKELVEANQLTVAIVFPDQSAAKRFSFYADTYVGGTAHAGIIDKKRPVDQNNVVTISKDQEDLTAKVAGKDVLMFDDMIDTGGSILQAARLAKSQGAKSVRIIATHGIFSKDALSKMNDSAIDGIIVTDSIAPRPDVLAHPKIQVVSIAPLIAEAIRRIEAREPIGNLVKSMSPDFEASYRKFITRANYYRRHH